MYPYKHQFVLNPEILDTGRVHYDLDINEAHWPWIRLPADHPALVGKYSFFLGIACGRDLLKQSPESASALTKVSWKNFPACFEGRPAESALAEISMEDEKIYYAADLMNIEGSVMQSMQAWGIVFQNRDYGSWRDRIKNAIECTRPEDFLFAAPESAGLWHAEECFVSPLHESRHGLSCHALIDKRTGFIPAHPWHTGTGDHVNASQQLDACLQAAHLVGRAQGWWRSGHRLECTAGEAIFRKYVELGAPFEIQLGDSKPLEDGHVLHFALLQNAKICAEILLCLR